MEPPIPATSPFSALHAPPSISSPMQRWNVAQASRWFRICKPFPLADPSVDLAAFRRPTTHPPPLPPCRCDCRSHGHRMEGPPYSSISPRASRPGQRGLHDVFSVVLDSAGMRRNMHFPPIPFQIKHSLPFSFICLPLFLGATEHCRYFARVIYSIPRPMSAAAVGTLSRRESRRRAALGHSAKRVTTPHVAKSPPKSDRVLTCKAVGRPCLAILAREVRIGVGGGCRVSTA